MGEVSRPGERGDHGDLLWDFVHGQVERRVVHGSLEELIVAAAEQGLSPTLDDVYTFVERERRRAGELCPRIISRFVAGYAAEIDAKTVLDPQAGSGSLILTVAERIDPCTAVALCPQEKSLEAGQVLDSRGIVSWLLGDIPANAEILDDEFDLILCAPPLGTPSVEQRFDGAQRPVRDSLGHLLVIRAGAALSAKGVGIFLVSPKFLLDRRRDCVRNRLSDFGLHLSGFLTVPVHAWGFPRSLGLALVRRGEAQDVFAGILTDNDKRNRILLENLVANRDGGSAAAGRLVPSMDFVSPDTIAAEERIARLKTRLGSLPGASERSPEKSDT